MSVLRLSVVFLLALSLSPFVAAEEPVTVKLYQQHARYDFGLKLLDLALSKLNKDYQVVLPVDQVNEARGEQLIMSGALDLEFMSATEPRERGMIPVRIPIYQGLLGLRLLLVKPEMNADIAKIKDIDDLRHLVGGHGAHWGDLPIYAANNMKVVTNASYEKLFEMLKNGRFDYFHRGISEIWAEQSRYADDFVVADNIMLYYPQPVYYFVGKHRPLLAQDLEKGLSMAKHDGSYKALFQSYYADILERANLESRDMIRLNNPAVPQRMPRIDTGWWIEGEKFRGVIDQ